MDGKNSTGRKVSLLNDFGGAAQTAIPLSRTLNNNHVNRFNSAKVPLLSSISTSSSTSARFNSQSPSSASTAPSLSPQTPPLVRSESTDSRTFVSSPSPVTPHFATFEQSLYSDRHHQPQQPSTAFPAKHHHHHHHLYYTSHTAPQGPPRVFYYTRPYSYAKMDDPSASIYPPLPDANSGVMAYPLSASNATAPSPQQHQQQQHPSQIRSSASPSSDAHASNGSKLLQPKKNQYPCPMAKEYQCTDYFTTSGHAARHAKKHTGKKDAFCPECNKAFTRKDNMEQHRRTHQNVRGPSKNPSAPAANNSDNRVKKSTKQLRKPDNKLVAASIEAAVNQQIDDQQQMLSQTQPLMASSQPQQAPTTLPQPIMSSGGGPYFVHADPIQALPQPMPIDFSGRPSLYRSNYPNSLDYIPQAAPTLQDAGDLHFNYPSPGLSNGLNTLALAASDHRRMSEEDSNHSS